MALSGSPFAPPGVDESTLPPPDKSADGIGVFDIAQNKMLRKVPGGSDPEQFAVSKDGRLLYVSNEDAAGLSLVDPSNGTVLKTLPTGEEPEGVMMSPDGRYIFVSSEDEGTIAVVDVAAQNVVKKIKVGRRPRGIAFLPDSSKAYITNENDSNLSVIDVAKLEAVGHDRDHRRRPEAHGDGDDQGREHALRKHRTRETVAVIATATGQVTASFEVGQRPWGIALSPDEKILFTANGPTGDISVVDLATKTVTKKIKVGDRPWGIAVVSQ